MRYNIHINQKKEIITTQSIISDTNYRLYMIKNNIGTFQKTDPTLARRGWVRIWLIDIALMGE